MHWGEWNDETRMRRLGQKSLKKKLRRLLGGNSSKKKKKPVSDSKDIKKLARADFDGDTVPLGEKEKKASAEKERHVSETKKYKADEARYLSDEELKRRNARLTAENNYRDALKKNHQKEKSKKRQLVERIFVDSAATAASSVMTQVYTKAATKFLENKFPELMGKK